MRHVNDGPEYGMERTLSREHYLSPEIFGREKNRIFWREWLCVGRDADLGEPGDYRVIDIAGESLIVLRTKSGLLRGYYNVCRHRGSQLIPMGSRRSCAAVQASGRFKGNIRCPYHSWTYDLDGTLKKAPNIESSEGFCKDALSLYPLCVEEWAGFLFVNLSPEDVASGYTLVSQLDEIPTRLQRYPLGELRSAHHIQYEVSANWKVILENYNECYHCAGVHPELCKIVPAFARNGGAGLDWDRGIPHRSGAYTFTFSGTSNRAPFPGLNADERVRHKGELAYPNLLISLSADHVAVFTLWPRGPEETLVCCDFLFHPDEMCKDSFDPSDAIEFWDVVNRQDWAICASVQRGMHSRVFQRGYYAPMEDLSLDIRRYVAERLE